MTGLAIDFPNLSKQVVEQNWEKLQNYGTWRFDCILGNQSFLNLYLWNGLKIIINHLALKALKDKSLLTERLLRRAEKLLKYDFDIICQCGKENAVPDFLSRLYLAEMSTANRVESDQQVALKKKKIFVPFENIS